MQAFILVNIAGENPASVARIMTNIEEVKNAHVVSGNCDIIAEIECDNFIKLREDIQKKIYNIKGVKRLSTLVVAARKV